jgi:hypothetical protein
VAVTVSWFFSVAQPADPAPCRDAVLTLRSVARDAEEAADFLAGQAALPTEDFSGLAARSYRDASAVLCAESRGIALDARALAAALDNYAVRIAAVRRALGRVRSDAVDEGFSVTADDLVEWVPAPATDIDAAYQRLEARALRAHAEAESAYVDWWRAAQEHTTGPLASLTTVPAPDPLVPATAPPVPIDERRDRVTRTATPAATATSANPEPPREAAAHHERRTGADHGVDLEFAPLPEKWQTLYDRPTATEGVPR